MGDAYYELSFPQGHDTRVADIRPRRASASRNAADIAHADISAALSRKAMRGH